MDERDGVVRKGQGDLCCQHMMMMMIVTETSFDYCLILYVYYINRLIGLVGRVFINDSGDLGSIPGQVIPKTLKMVLVISLLNTQQYKVRIEGKVEQFRERSSDLPYTSM